MVLVAQFRGLACSLMLSSVIGMSNCFVRTPGGWLRSKSIPTTPVRFAYLYCLGTVSSGAEGGRVRLEHWLYTIPLRVRSIFRRAKVEQELDEELHLHLEQLMAQEMAAGKTPDEARISSLKAMDGIERRKEECRDMRRVHYIENIVADLRHGLRIVRKSPVFAAAITAILALGIGANTAVFSIVDAVLLRPLPYQSPGRLVRIEETSARQRVDISPQEYLQWRNRGDLFEKIAAQHRDDVTVTGIGEPDQVNDKRTT